MSVVFMSLRISTSVIVRLMGVKEGREAAIENVIQTKAPEMFERCARRTGRSYIANNRITIANYEDLDLDSALYQLRCDTSCLSQRKRNDAKNSLMGQRMKVFGTDEEIKSKDSVEKLLKMRKWHLEKYLDNKVYSKEYDCETPDGEIKLTITGRLDGVAKHKNTRAIVEVKNRLRGLLYFPRECELCQVRVYMDITGMDKAFLFERHVRDGEEFTNVVILEREEDFIDDIVLLDPEFQESIGTITKCIKDEDALTEFLSKAPLKN